MLKETAGRTDAAVPAEGRAFAVTRLVLTNFRCYEALRLALDGRPVVLTGPNGAGKTNLLEAISFLAPGRGLRRARLSEVARRGHAEAGWAVAATIEGPEGAREVGTGLPSEEAADGAAERRTVRVDGAPARGQAALAEAAAVSWLTPEMDRLFVEGASARRRFLDRIVYGFDPQHAGRVAAYETAMRQRLRLLRDGAHDRAWLGALETTMAERGVAIAAARLHVVQRLDRACGLTQAPFPRAGLSLDGTVEDALAAGPALAAEDGLRAALEAGRGADAESGRTGAGPHRSDLRVRYLAKDVPAEAASTGEQKALLIAIVLANARLQALERGAAPLLLLDEVVAHLDKTRRAALFDELVALGAQAWLTGTDAALFAPLGDGVQFLGIENGSATGAAG